MTEIETNELTIDESLSQVEPPPVHVNGATKKARAASVVKTDDIAAIRENLAAAKDAAWRRRDAILGELAELDALLDVPKSAPLVAAAASDPVKLTPVAVTTSAKAPRKVKAKPAKASAAPAGLRDGSDRQKVHAYLAKHDGAAVADIASAFKMKGPKVSGILSGLKKAGLATSVGGKRDSKWSAAAVKK